MKHCVNLRLCIIQCNHVLYCWKANVMGNKLVSLVVGCRLKTLIPKGQCPAHPPLAGLLERNGCDRNVIRDKK
uniref:Uncharacterized protein n=1 Tax=Anguilla anguilla TaxID=7936 RepID=A0A0E9X091_ANGAN